MKEIEDANSHRGEALPYVRALAFVRRAQGRILVLCVAMALGCAGVAGYAAMGDLSDHSSVARGTPKQTTPNPTQEAIDRFVTVARQKRIDKAVLHYRRWEKGSVGAITEETLTRGSDLEVTLRGNLIQTPILVLANTVANSYRERRTLLPSDRPVDFGIDIICYSTDDEIIRVSVSKEPPILSVAGERMPMRPEVLYVLAPLLPAVTYEGMFLHIMHDWASLDRRPSPKDPESLSEALRGIWRGLGPAENEGVWNSKDVNDTGNKQEQPPN